MGGIKYFTNWRYVKEVGTENLNGKQKKIVESYCLNGATAGDIAMLFYGNKNEDQVSMAKSYLEELTRKNFLAKGQRR